MSLRYIRHSNHPPSELEAVSRDILNALVAEVRRVEKHAPKTRKTGSVYTGITGSALMAHHLSIATAQLEASPGLSPNELLAFTDARLTQALSLAPTALSNPSSGDHSSFLGTAVGIATLILIRAVEHVSLTTTLSASPFRDNWASCAELLASAVSMSLSEDRRHDADDGGCEVLYGRAGLLYALLRLRTASKHNDTEPMDSNSGDLVTTIRELSSRAQIELLVESIIQRGKSGATIYAVQLAGKLPAPPLMWTWHGKCYLGAAHGVAGILHILLLCPADIVHPHMESILRTVEWLIGCQDTHGNWPTAAPLDPAEYRSDKELVQWCHGAPGVLLLLCTVLRCATFNLPRTTFRQGYRVLDFATGVAGSVFALLAVSDVLDRVHTNKNKLSHSDTTQPSDEEYCLMRAVHLAHLAVGHEAVPDHPWSLYEGLAGMCCAWAEQGLKCDRSGMPGFD
ncbi:hypothetical protein C8F04DRAFT_1126326 [Mycena alexandri]|uniref:Lanthionine synthetase C family protein n=1 Tax=Mycena alexandri TaxID=1745969 RepID=A0AAD6SFA2_9AGAR|nr:hypothetical protein C8F04DRAFT_1126326 [Mycena alexandri]